MSLTPSPQNLSLMEQYIRRQREVPPQLRGDGITDQLGRRVIGTPRPMMPGEKDTLPTYLEFFCKLFDLSDEAQQQEYVKIMRGVYNNKYLLRQRVNMPDNGHMKVYLEWVEVCTRIPEINRQPNNAPEDRK